jgi:hypothetical protein
MLLIRLLISEVNKIKRTLDLTQPLHYKLNTMKNNNNGYEYEIEKNDAQGWFVEVYATDNQGKRGEMHLSIFVNHYEGETVEGAISACETELYDPMFIADAGEPKHIIARQRVAFQWFKEAYASVQDFKSSI